MCYASPGPRCYSHAKADVEKTQAQYDELEKRVKKLDDDVHYFIEKHQELSDKEGCPPGTLKHYKDQAIATAKQRDMAKQKMKKVQKKNHAAIEDAYATKGGMAALEESIIEIQSRGFGAEFQIDELDKAKKTYAARMEKYDEKNQTVDGRKPSIYGNDEGIDELRGKLKDTQKKLAETYQNDLIKGTDSRKKIDRLEEQERRLKGQLSHAYATDRHIQAGIIADPKRIAKLREEAAQRDKDAQESYERSDTDGAMSQWAAGLGADKRRMEADLMEKGGKTEFNALFDKKGNLVPAKQVTVADRYRPGHTKTAWVVLSDPNDVDSSPKEWINESSSSDLKKQEEYLKKKGYTMGRVRVPAYVATRGDGVNVRNMYARKDRGFTPDAEVVSKNIFPSLISFYKKRDEENERINREKYGTQED